MSRNLGRIELVMDKGKGVFYVSRGVCEKKRTIKNRKEIRSKDIEHQKRLLIL